MDDTEIISRNYNNYPVEVNQNIELFYDCSRLLFFDPDNGERIYI